MSNNESEPSPRELLRAHLPQMTAVAFIDLLGTTKATSQIGLEQVIHGNSLETIWNFLGDLCQVYPGIQVSGISDSLVIFRQDFSKLLPMIVALFQICCLTRGFRIRGGLEIGNVFGVGRELERRVRQGAIPNMIIPQYIYGDAITGAVLAERTLKGSRLVLGKTLTSSLQRAELFEPQQIFVNRDGGIVEVNWTDQEYTSAIFTELNRINRYSGPEETLEYGFRRYLESPEDDYSKVMIGLGSEWGVLRCGDRRIHT